MEELKKLIGEQGKAFEAFKEANDTRLALIEAKEPVPADLTEKLVKIEAAMTAQGEEYKELLKKSQRPQTAGDQKSEDLVEREAAMSAFMRTGNIQGLAKIQGVSTSDYDPNVGWFVLPEMDTEIDRIVGTISAIAGISKTVNLTSGPKWVKFTKTSGMSMRRVDDGNTGGETDGPEYSKVEIEAFTAEVEPWAHNETLADSTINLANDFADEAGIGFAEGLGSEYAIGDGVNKARGITAYNTVANASYAWGSVGYIASGAAGAFATSAPADQLVALQHALKAQYRPGAQFVMADSTLLPVRQMKDASGAYYLWQPDTTAGFGGRLLGSPVVIDDNMPVIAANSLSIAFGNFPRSYAVVNREGTTLIRDNITAKGKTKFNFRKRAGGGIYNFEGIKLLKFASS